MNINKLKMEMKMVELQYLIDQEKKFLREIEAEDDTLVLFNSKKQYYEIKKRFPLLSFSTYLKKVGVDYAIASSEAINYLYQKLDKVCVKYLNLCNKEAKKI
jgi:hypothetical protein